MRVHSVLIFVGLQDYVLFASGHQVLQASAHASAMIKMNNIITNRPVALSLDFQNLILGATFELDIIKFSSTAFS